MPRYNGLEARLGNTSIATPYNQETIGDIVTFEVNGQGEDINIPRLGIPYNQDVELTRVRPELSLTYHPQNTSYLHNYLIVQTGNNIATHVMGYYNNSSDMGVLLNAKPVTVDVAWELNRPLVVKATLLGTNWTTGLVNSKGNFSATTSSTEPMTNIKVMELQILDGATVIRDLSTIWRRGGFNINYNTEPVWTGTGVTPSDVVEGVRGVRGNVELSVNESTKLLSYVTNASYLNIKVGFSDPMSSTYTFFSSVIRINTVTVQGVDVQRQRLEWSCRYITRSSM